MFYLAEIVSSSTIENNVYYILIAFAISIVLFLIMMIYYKARINRLEDYVTHLKQKNKEQPDISEIAKQIKADLAKEVKRPANFEAEQEEDAVISYQELLNKESKPKVEVAPKFDPQIEVGEEPVATLISSEKKEIKSTEDEFLSKLVSLRKNLK